MFRKRKLRKAQRNQGNNQNARTFSYYRNRSTEAGLSNNTKTKKRRLSIPSVNYVDSPRWIRQLPLLIAFGAILVSFIYMGYLGTDPVVLTQKVASIEESPFRSRQEYAEAASSILKRSIWQRNKITFSSHQAEAAFKEMFPEVNDVSIVVPLVGKRPVLGINFTDAKYEVSANGTTYVVGANGKILGTKNDLRNLSNEGLIRISDETKRDLQVGKTLFTSQEIKQINSITEEIEANGHVIEKFMLIGNATELRLKLKGDNYFIKFSGQADMHQQLGALYAVKEQLREEGKTPSEYIDVRLAERAFIK